MDQSLGAWGRAKEQLILLLFFLTQDLLFIVDNGNILTDRTNERKCLQRKYDEMLFYLFKYII